MIWHNHNKEPKGLCIAASTAVMPLLHPRYYGGNWALRSARRELTCLMTKRTEAELTQTFVGSAEATSHLWAGCRSRVLFWVPQNSTAHE